MISHQLRRSLTTVAAAVATTAVTLTLSPAVQASENLRSSQSSQTAATGPTPIARDARAVDVRLRVANSGPRAVSTTRGFAPRLLTDEGVRFDRNDKILVIRNGQRVRGTGARRLRTGDTVRVVRVAVRTRTVRDRFAPRTINRTVGTLAPGKRRVTQAGRHGVRKVRIERTLHNGSLVGVDRTSRVVRAAKPRRVNVGRAFGSVAGANHLRWAALANCESSGNPRAVNPAGYYGLYQFNTGTWGTVGGRGLPSKASAAEQTYRAKLLYKSRGRSPWPHCGRYL